KSTPVPTLAAYSSASSGSAAYKLAWSATRIDGTFMASSLGVYGRPVTHSRSSLSSQPVTRAATTPSGTRSCLWVNRAESSSTHRAGGGRSGLGGLLLQATKLPNRSGTAWHQRRRLRRGD